MLNHKLFNIPNMNITERIIEKMKEKGLKQIDLVKATKATKGTVSLWVKGQTVPSGENLIKLANALKVSPEWLQTGKEPRNRVDVQALPVMSLDDATPEDLARIILAYEQSSELKKHALQKLSELPEDKLTAILALLG
jgi:transcriptional regulator with XRE-family HTH domain